MSFDERFELGELVRFDGVRTFAARDRASGQELLAHFLENSSEAAALLASLDRLPERERQRIVDRGEREGVAYVVTGSLAGHAGLREWLAANAHEPRPLHAAGAWKVVLPENGPEKSVDEQFLALFPTGETAQANPQETAPQAQQVPRRREKEPGEFTRLFQAQPPSAPRPPAASPIAPPPAPPAGKADEPGEFTRMFQAPAQTAAPQPKTPASPIPTPAASKRSEGPGEFTRFFEAQTPSAAGPRNPAAPAAQPGPSASKPGEFTQFFEAQARPGAGNPFPGGVPPMPAAPLPPKQGEFTKVFGAGEMRKLAPNPIPPPAAPSEPREAARPSGVFASPKPTPPPVAPQGPGEYTRMFASAPSLTLGQAAQETSGPPRPSHDRAVAATSAPSSRWPLILGISAAVVLLAVVVLILVGRHK
jgi:hypothetical protein